MSEDCMLHIHLQMWEKILEYIFRLQLFDNIFLEDTILKEKRKLHGVMNPQEVLLHSGITSKG